MIAFRAWWKKHQQQAVFNRNVGDAQTDGYGYCAHCGRGWNRVEAHSLLFDERHGMFPVCEECWSTLSKEERIVYCRALAVEWRATASIHHLPITDVEAIVAGATATIDAEIKIACALAKDKEIK